MNDLVDPAADLFAAAALPAGLHYEEAFLSPDEEAYWLAQVRSLALTPAPYKQYTSRRRIASFGGRYDFSAQRLEPAAALPPVFEPLRVRVAAAMGVHPAELAQVLVTEYAVGTPLGWHRDTPEFEIIAGVSLAADCEMRWRPFPTQPTQPPQRHGPTLKLRIARRSLYVMRAAARWDWQHSVVATTALRYSITWRTLRRGRA